MLMRTLICVSLLSFSFTSLLANVNFEGGDSIQLKGKVFHANEKVKNSRIVIYIGNEKYKTLDLKKTNKSKTNIPLNAVLTVEMMAPNFILKRFIIDTHMPNGKKKRLKYKFDMDLFSEAELAGVNTSILDFPIGLVSYKNGEFINDDKYTHQMKMESFRLLEDTKLSDRNAISTIK